MYFLYMLCSEGARRLISQMERKMGKDTAARWSRANKTKGSREIKERKLLGMC